MTPEADDLVKLADCPFCGCAATFVKHSAGIRGTQGFDSWDAVACKHCRATIGACDRRFREKRDAAIAWNRRIAAQKAAEVDAQDAARWRKCLSMPKSWWLKAMDDASRPHHYGGKSLIASIDEQIAAASPAEPGGEPQAPEWLPIESAPKHKEVLVWREDSGPFIAKLTTPDAVITPEEMEREGLDFPDDFEEWFSDAYGWQEGTERPTHYMLLPAGPADASKEGER